MIKVIKACKMYHQVEYIFCVLLLRRQNYLCPSLLLESARLSLMVRNLISHFCKESVFILLSLYLYFSVYLLLFSLFVCTANLKRKCTAKHFFFFACLFVLYSASAHYYQLH